jgi:hypothetical protein
MSLAELLDEIQCAIDDVEAAHPDLAAWAQELIDACRDACGKSDAAAAALTALQLGERLAEIRLLAAAVQPTTGRWKNRRDQRASERTATYRAAIARGNSPAVALARTAEKHGVSTKTIRRELKSFNLE